MINQETGEIIDTVPVNDYLYAMAGHGKHLEEQFDKYSGDGSYREMCAFLDEEVKSIQTAKNHTVDKYKIKEQLLRMADMVNNKIYILQSKGCINQHQKDAFVGRFNFVFNQALQEYDIGPLTQEDIKKITESMNKSKINAESQFNKQTKENIEIEELESDNPEENATNMHEEAITPITDEMKEQQQSDNKLTLKQRFAHFIQNNKIFMNLSFVKNFVDKQINVLPPASKEQQQSPKTTKQDFYNYVTNFGKNRNLPPIQRMSDPQKLDEMRKKMEQNQEIEDDVEK